MTLLSPSETLAFQSFLAHIDGDGSLDFPYANHDWAYFTTNGVTAPAFSSSNGASTHARTHLSTQSQGGSVNHEADADQPHPPEVVKYAAEAHVQALPRVEGERKHLALATKSLMSLDSNPIKWSESADRDIPMPPQQLAPPQPLNAISTSSKSNGMNDHRTQNSTLRTPVERARASSSSVTSDISSSHVNAVASSSKLSHNVPSSPATNGVSTSKRPFVEDLSIPASSSVELSAASTSSVSSPSSSQPGPAPKKHRSSTPQRRQSGSTHPTMSSRPAPLLTPLQKKANHIQSEQKRRANIRRGYEALCETVPALREAIRAEEEAQALALAAEVNGEGKPKRKRGPRRKSGEVDEDKVDGRAGPRSENVVLQKTIDYIRDLISERNALLSRLERARGSLPPSHPCLSSISSSQNGVPLWEREWTGGSGKDPDMDNEGRDGGDRDDDARAAYDDMDEGASESES